MSDRSHELRSVEVLRHSASAISMFSLDGTLLMQNTVASELFESPREGNALLARFASEGDGRALLRHVTSGGQVLEEPHALNTARGVRSYALSARRCTDPVSREPAFVFEARALPGEPTPQLPFSEARFRQLCMHLPIGIYETTADGALIFANTRWCELADLSAERASGLGWQAAIHPDDLDRLLHGTRNHGANEFDVHVHFRFRHADGEARWVTATNLPQRDAAGAVIGYLGAVIDVTESVESEQQFALVFEQSSDAHLMLDEQRTVLDCNQSALRLLGASAKIELLGKTLDELSPDTQPDGRASPRALDTEQRLLTEQGTCRYSWTLCRQDGSLVPTEVAVTMLTTQGEIRMFTSVRDITEREREREAILRSREAALEASRVKSQFLANMSHEIRTPMHGVLGMLSLALGTALTPEQQEFIVTARSSAENLLDIINDILDLSKLEAGRLSIETLDVDLESLLSAALRSTALRAQAKGIEVSVEVGQEVPRRFVGDSLRLRQVLINLFGNAVKFTHVGHILIAISVLDGKQLRFAVEDTGAGISAERQKLVFEAFQQADNSLTRRYGGTGLGLTISKELVERMGGQMELTSEEGKGSTFAFTLPLQPARTSMPTHSPHVDLRGSTVLVLHVNAMARRVLSAALAQRGARVLQASCVPDAQRLLALARSVRAAFVDHRLDDDNNALELPGKLRAFPSCADTRWVLLRSAERVSGTQLREAGYAYALDKPVLPSDIDRALTEAMPDPTSKLSPLAPSEEKNRHSLSVLVVEDHPVNAHFMTSLLARWGHQVVHAWNGKNALAVLAEQSFDVILMDKHMPVMDGLETTRHIRAREAGTGKRVPIIALTASAMKGDEEECLAAGMDYFLDKPVVIETLDRALTRVGSPRAKGRTRAQTPVADTPGAATTELPAFSREALLARACGDTRFQADLIQVFLASQDEMMQGLEQALASLDPYPIRQAAHRLKGGLQLVCAEPAAQLALALEKAAREGDSARFASLGKQLRQEVSRLRAALGDFHAEDPSGTKR